MKNQNKKSFRKNRANAQNTMSGNPDPVGDDPGPSKRTYRTASVRIPRVTAQFCTRQMTRQIITSTPTTDVVGNFVFQLSNLPGYTAFTTVFDQYRLDAVRVSVVPQNNAIGLVTNSTTSLSPFINVIDYDDASNLGSVNAALEYDNCIVLRDGETMERSFAPRLAVAAYAGGFTSYANLGPVWIDCASSGVSHYGMKYIVPAVTTGQTTLQSWECVFEYFFSFRSVRA